ncbi:MAG: prepilin-type N-terminal cleavage/methylation domain-containing protein [Candidatus Polarisedimenticolaceae bacterium]|nr:prepilin-type N-terminal cleavage/methylation domain-containing protein [Candidatus Polarisedimenticolaceae bacterium]
MSRCRQLSKNQTGFSLLEVLVAFVILSLVLTMVFRLISGTLGNVSTVDGYTRALILAESTMARLGSEIPLEVGENHGDEGDNFSWSLSITPFEDSSETVALNPPDQQAMLYQAVVLVNWKQGSKRHSLQLDTLRVSEERPNAP